MMHSTSSSVADGPAPPSSPPAHHFEIGDEEDEHDEDGENGHRRMMVASINGNRNSNGDVPGEQSFGNDEEIGGGGGGGDAAAPSPYQVFRTPVNVDFAESSVVAPCDLPEGHNLRVDLGRGRILVVQVPFGGAKKGDTFYAPYRIYDKPDEAAREYQPSVDSPRNRKVGAWRASLCGCCEFGPCHPSSLGAFLCQCFLLSQVLTRMHLNCLAQKSPPSASRQTLDGVFLVFAIFYFFRGVTVYFWATGDDETNAAGAEQTDLQGNFYAMTLIVDFFFIVYLIAVSTRGRMAIRNNYQIPGDCVSDCIVSTICHPCALSQMARQSANYRDHGYRWCSDTGVDEKYDGEYGLNMSDGVHSMNMSDRDLI